MKTEHQYMSRAQSTTSHWW